ncbi:MAG: site-specific integrase [Ruminococcus sp.]|nr:site-specific integrase [Ruminococcus sp.]
MSRGSIYQRKDGRWEARLSLGFKNGKRQSRSFYGRTRSEAENKLFEYSHNSLEPVISDMFVSELCAEWLGICKSRVKLSTYVNYRLKVEKHIIPHFGDTMCCAVGTKEAYGFIQKKLDSGLSARYVADIIVLLKSLFKYARKEYGICDPFEDVSLPKGVKPEIRLLTNAEQERLKAYLDKHRDNRTLGITLALAMGLRVGEVCGLMWQDIDFEKRILTVRRTVQRVGLHTGNNKTQVIITSPKSATSAREIPIPAGVFALLEDLRSAPERFILSDTIRPAEPRIMQYHFAKILKNAGLPSVRFHSLRHRFACSAVAAGFDVKTLSEILGHSRVELTMNLYIHSDLERKRACMDLLNWSDNVSCQSVCGL